jgi:hypothetical protein
MTIQQRNWKPSKWLIIRLFGERCKYSSGVCQRVAIVSWHWPKDISADFFQSTLDDLRRHLQKGWSNNMKRGILYNTSKQLQK